MPTSSDDRSWLWDYETHPDIATETDFERFHQEVSLWQQLVDRGVNPAVFAVALALVVVAPGALILSRYDLTHPLATPPMLGVLGINTLISLLAVFYIDRRFPAVMQAIRPAFDVPDESYYGFIGRLFERLYQYSFYAPITKAPAGRGRNGWFWAGLVGNYVGWVVVLGLAFPTPLPQNITGKALVVGYFLLIVGYAALSLFTAVMFLWFVTVYLTVKASRFPISLRLMRTRTRFGLRPYGLFIYKTLLIGMTIAGVAGLVGLLVGNPLLLIFASLFTPLVFGWFLLSQFGIHWAIRRTKRIRLQSLESNHARALDHVFLESTPEPDLEAVQTSESFVTVKSQIEALPTWPIDVRLLLRAVSVTLLGNLPSVIGLLV